MENRIDLVLYNSYDLTSILDLYAGILRKVCANGLIAWDKMYNFKHKHIGFNMGEFLESARSLAGSMGNISGRIEDMQRTSGSLKSSHFYDLGAHASVSR